MALPHYAPCTTCQNRRFCSPFNVGFGKSTIYQTTTRQPCTCRWLCMRGWWLCRKTGTKSPCEPPVDRHGDPFIKHANYPECPDLAVVSSVSYLPRKIRESGLLNHPC
ncbi:hypothetical protein IQ07DRAFT_83391 [Pyrenochaeta sp. DS3sAY3a]|nr:hypothetical protein IQ07DRAFT_83391 [Pyrenochaeta sp. DS3sAY3a]